MASVRDRDNFPRALHDGRYGCQKCGAFQDKNEGEKLTCNYCNSAKPLADMTSPNQKATWGDRPLHW